MAGRTPDIVFRHKVSPQLQIAAWNDEGELTFNVTKRYYDKETKQWKCSGNFFCNDLIALESLCREANEWANHVWRNLDEQQKKALGEKRQKQRLQKSEADYENGTRNDESL